MQSISAEREHEARNKTSGLAMSRRGFLGLGGAALLGLGLYGSEFERHDVQVEEHAVSLRGLGDSFHGMRIAQISDLHYDEYTEPYFIREVVARVNSLKPDMVLLTGDFVSYGPFSKSFGARHANPCAALLQKLESPLRYAVMGNHDAEVGANVVTDALTTHGITVLRNKYVPLERDGKRLWIGGVEDVLEQRPRLELAVPSKLVSGNDPVILMAHEPDFADRVARHGGVDFTVSGHTHGGQVRLPLVGPLTLPPLGRKYVQGFFQIGPTLLYVNRGIGSVGLPIRIDCRPEITVFTLSAGT
jgi:predicted MPP superfamily phosphohydrolase